MPDEIKNQTQEEGTGSKIPALRTLKTDTSEYVKKKGVSLIEIAAEEARGTGIRMEEEGNAFSRKKIIIISAFAAVAIGIGILGILFFAGREKEAQPTLFYKPIIASEDQQEVNFYQEGGQAAAEKIKNALASQTKINQLVYISLVKQSGELKSLISSEEFFRLAGISPPKELIDSFDSEFMLSKFYFSKDWPILIFKISSFDSAFVGAIKWEKTMADDLGNIFSLDLSNTDLPYKDKEIQNHDARVLFDKNGQMLLLYSFVGRDYLIITTGEEPLKEVFRRFSSVQYLNR